MTAPERRRIYLMRHAQVRYFRGEHPHDVLLTEDGRAQAAAAAEALRGVSFDRVITSGLPRTLDTASTIAPHTRSRSNPELREIESGDLRGVAPEIVQEMMTTAFRGVVPLDTQFLGGETIGELFDRVLPELDALLADETLGHRRSSCCTAPSTGRSSAARSPATGLPRRVRAGACLHQRPRRRSRAARSSFVPLATRPTTPCTCRRRA